MSESCEIADDDIEAQMERERRAQKLFVELAEEITERFGDVTWDDLIYDAENDGIYCDDRHNLELAIDYADNVGWHPHKRNVVTRDV